MGATATAIAFVPVGEYLGSVYRPDVDYVDGVLEERNVGEFGHNKIQRALMQALIALEQEGDFFAIQEQRVQITPTRYRVPDVCVLSNERLPEEIVYDAPLLCIEVLSARDTVSGMRDRSHDYLRAGVPEVWIFDGSSRSAYVLREDSFVQHHDDVLRLRSTCIQVSLGKIFAVLDTRSAR